MVERRANGVCGGVVTNYELNCMADELLTDLEDLLAHKGWMVLMDRAEQEWGKVGFSDKVAKTLGSTTLDEKVALAQLQQATVTQREIWRLLGWPKEKIQHLRGQQKEALMAGTASRRGPGL